MANSYNNDIQLSVDLNADDALNTSEQLGQSIRQVFSASTGREMSTQLRSILSQFSSLEASANNIREQMSELEAVGRISGVDVSEPYARLGERLAQVNNGIITVRSRLDDLANKGDETADRLGRVFRQSERPEILNIIQLVTNGFRTIISAAINVATTLGNRLAKGAFNLVIIGLKKLANAAKTAANNLAKMVSSKIKSGISSLAKSFLHLGKNSNSANFSFQKGLRTFIRYGLGMRSLFALVNKLRKALIDGLGQMAESFGPFGAVVTDFKNSVELLKGSFASVAAPVLQQALPAITTFINKLSEGVSMIGKFIAALQGKSMFVKATSAVADTAKQATGALKNTAKAAKEAQKELFGFDQINRFSKQNDEDYDGGGSGDSGETGPNITFEEVPIEDIFAEFAKRIKEMWANADFTKLGTLIGEKLKEALENIPWDSIKLVLQKIGKSIATLLNGFLEVSGLFETIGETLAEALNSAFEFVNAFVTNFHWDSLGKAIKDLLIGVFTNIDWPLIYDTLAKLCSGIGTTLETALDNPQIWNDIFAAVVRGFNALVIGIDSFVTAINWGSLAQNIGFGLNNAMDLIDWQKISNTLTHSLNALFDFVYELFTTIDFFRFGTYVGETLSNVLNNVDWEKGGASVAAMVNALMDSLDGFISRTDWGKLGAAVVDTIGGYLGEFDWKRLGHLLSSTAKALLDALTGAFEKVNWDELPDKITTKISEFLEGFDWKGTAESVGKLIGAAFKAAVAVGSWLLKKMKEFGKDLIEGGWKGIKEKISTVATWIKENILDPFIKGFKDAFGISSPSKVMMKYGKYIIDGIFQGIIGAIRAVATWIDDHIVQPFIRGLKTAFGIISGTASKLKTYGETIIEGLKKGITNALSTIITWVKTNIFDKFMKGVTEAFNIIGTTANKLKDVGKAIIAGVKDGITNALSTIKTWVQNNLAKPMLDAIDFSFGIGSGIGIATKLIGKGKALIEGLKSGADDNYKVVSWVKTNVFDNLSSTIDSAFGIAGGIATKLKSKGSAMISGIKSGTDENFGSLKSGFSSQIDAVKNIVTSKDWNGAGSTLTNKIGTGIHNTLSAIKGSADSINYKIADTIGGKNWGSTGSSITIGIGNAIDYYKNYATNAASWLGYYIESKVDSGNWYNIGYNICSGIANGMNNNSWWVEDTAWNIGVNALNAAKWALGIYSPSRVFRDEVGAMIPKGLAVGIENESSVVTDAMNDLTSIVTDTGNIELPDIVGGKVIPYSAGGNSEQDDISSTLNRVADMLEYNQSDTITRTDLETILINAIQRYMKIDFYIGDEQIARHANAGNVKIDRRFNPSIA